MVFKPLKINKHLTWISLVALAAGILIGAYSPMLEKHEWLKSLIVSTELFGILWVNIIQIVALPTILFLIWFSLSKDKISGLGKLGLGCVMVFLALHVLGGIYAVTASPALIHTIPLPDPENIEAIKNKVGMEGAAGTSLDGVVYGFFQILFGNPYVKFAKSNLWIWISFPLLINFYSHFILKRDLVNPDYLQRILQFLFRIIIFLVHIVPLGMMGLVITICKSIGLSLVSILAYYCLTICIVLAVYMLLLIVLTKLVSGYEFSTLWQALKAPYLVAFSSRSSLASMPVLAEEAQKHLPVSPQIVNFSFPLTVTFFKANRMVSSNFHFLFLAYVFQVDISYGALLFFMLFVVINSLVSKGIPSGGNSYANLPLYVDAGIPAEGYFLIKSVDAIPDIFSTLINTTSLLTVAACLQRFFPASVSSIPLEMNKHFT